jgi:hypothetical protein
MYCVKSQVVCVIVSHEWCFLLIRSHVFSPLDNTDHTLPAGRPGGPGFYISTVDNTHNHGPASQGSKTEADSVFGRIVRGLDVVEKMKKQPGAGGSGFISNPANFIRIPSLRLLSAEDVLTLGLNTATTTTTSTP